MEIAHKWSIHRATLRDQAGEFALELGGEVVVREDAGVLKATEDIVRDATEVAIRDGGFNGTLSGIGYRAMLANEDAEQVVEAVVGCNAVEVMDLVVERNRLTAPGAIDGMGDEDVFVVPKRIMKGQIPLFAICVG